MIIDNYDWIKYLVFKLFFPIKKGFNQPSWNFEYCCEEDIVWMEHVILCLSAFGFIESKGKQSYSRVTAVTFWSFFERKQEMMINWTLIL